MAAQVKKKSALAYRPSAFEVSWPPLCLSPWSISSATRTALVSPRTGPVCFSLPPTLTIPSSNRDPSLYFSLSFAQRRPSPPRSTERRLFYPSLSVVRTSRCVTRLFPHSRPCKLVPSPSHRSLFSEFAVRDTDDFLAKISFLLLRTLPLPFFFPPTTFSASSLRCCGPSCFLSAGS